MCQLVTTTVGNECKHLIGGLSLFLYLLHKQISPNTLPPDQIEGPLPGLLRILDLRSPKTYTINNLSACLLLRPAAFIWLHCHATPVGQSPGNCQELQAPAAFLGWPWDPADADRFPHCSGTCLLKWKHCSPAEEVTVGDTGLAPADLAPVSSLTSTSALHSSSRGVPGVLFQLKKAWQNDPLRPGYTQRRQILRGETRSCLYIPRLWPPSVPSRTLESLVKDVI